MATRDIVGKAVGRTLEVEVAKQAAERRNQAEGQPQGSKVSSGKSPQQTGRTRDIVGKAVEHWKWKSRAKRLRRLRQI